MAQIHLSTYSELNYSNADQVNARCQVEALLAVYI